MAEPLKNSFGADVPKALAHQLRQVHPQFDAAAFVKDALQGYDALELLPRGRHIAQALRKHLPPDYARALPILLESTQVPVQRTVSNSMAGFYFMPHCQFVAQFGLAHFEESMQANYLLTQKFTAEFSVRPYLIHHQEAALARLRTWAQDPNEHVRRLVSEGSRPRLPWATRLPAFQADPTPVLALLELLKDDPALYVRRSVANNLNDIGKDHPQVLNDVAQRWLKNAPAEREWVVRHALRWAVKQGDAGALAALAVLGFGKPAEVTIGQVRISPANAQVGDSVAIEFTLGNPASRPQALMVDFQIHYVKASGGTAPKVFKLKALNLPPHGSVQLHKNVSLREMTTLKHHAGKHRVDVIVNGKIIEIGLFLLNFK